MIIELLEKTGLNEEDKDRLLGELCVRYEQFRGNSGDGVIDKIYGHTFNRSDNYFHEKWEKFINQAYAFACHLDGGNRPRLGKTLREYIEKQEGLL